MRMENRHGIGTVAIIVICLILVIAVAVVAPVVVPNIFSAKQTADRAVAQSSLRAVVYGLDMYREFHGEYPLVPEDMRTPPDGGAPYVSAGALEVPGYVYEYTSYGNRYILGLVPHSGQGAHYYADETTTIRYSWDQPADENSTVLYEAIAK